MTWYTASPTGSNTMTQYESNNNMNNNNSNNPPRLSSLLSSTSSSSSSLFQGTRNTRIEQPTANNKVSAASPPFSIFGKKRTYQEHTTIPFSNNNINGLTATAVTSPFGGSSTSSCSNYQNTAAAASQWVPNEEQDDDMMNDEQYLCTKRVRYSMRAPSSSTAFLSPIVSWCRSKSGSIATTTAAAPTSSPLENSSQQQQQPQPKRAELIQRCQQYQKNSDQLSYCHVCNIPYAPYLSVLGDGNSELGNEPPPQRNTLLSYFTKVKKNKSSLASSSSSTSFMVSDNDVFEKVNDRMNSNNNEKSHRIQSSLSSLFVSQPLKTNPSSLSSSLSFNPLSSSASTFVCSYCEHTNVCQKCRKQCSVCYKQFCSFCVTSSSSNDDTTAGSEQIMICADCNNNNSGTTNVPNQMNYRHENQTQPQQAIRRSTSTYDFDTMDLDD